MARKHQMGWREGRNIFRIIRPLWNIVIPCRPPARFLKTSRPELWGRMAIRPLITARFVKTKRKRPFTIEEQENQIKSSSEQ